MVEYYQTTMFVIGSMLGRSMNLIALSLVGIGVAYISNESQKVFIFKFLFEIFFYKFIGSESFF
jgi:hypothetical protein